MSARVPVPAGPYPSLREDGPPMFELTEPPVTGPVPVIVASPVPLRALRGIDWEAIAAESSGLVALVDVPAGEGELQEWGCRGNDAAPGVASRGLVTGQTIGQDSDTGIAGFEGNRA